MEQDLENQKAKILLETKLYKIIHQINEKRIQMNMKEASMDFSFSVDSAEIEISLNIKIKGVDK